MKQQPLLGFIFALTTAMAWGSLPIALQQVLNAMSMQTIVWFRFVVATAALAIFLGLAKKLPKLSDLNRYFFGLVILGIIGLSGNFSLFNTSLKFIDPSVAQIFIHFSSFAMLFCGIVIFKEKLGLHQKIGLVILIIGLILFFNERAEQLFAINIYSIGVFLSLSASLIWVTYGLAQKLLLRRFNSQQILLMIYTGCALVFTPFVEVEQVQNLSTFTLVCFIYCCLNTLIGYGSYAEALNRWDVAKVSVVITLVPLFTILFAHLLHFIYPQHFTAPELNTLSYIGAFIVVLGAMISAIGYKFIKNKN
ncbi:EamA family transporter [Canicola haemoglobinophilus]|uniref:Inner membrane protein n=1 Tax=Canicola haemoglobinophilus TaxID=733 RepID=A0A1V4B2X6_9PAST|nr:DMT family transporter [Canicola haemoglobinophilus]OOS01624.1 EamA family transporter [Canicola haemoglobinophilus]STO55589.1 inner membrane protein [Canicola haemoglobinophilus]STO58919.1 inner membrane protein [Canicola haemoglobinophilus]STO67915.1 inner membrane protein [Canicola haemoglobinophilus]